MFTMQKIPNDLEFSKIRKIILSLVIKHFQEKQFLRAYRSISLSLSLSLRLPILKKTVATALFTVHPI